MKKKLNLMTLSVEEKKKVLGGGTKCVICRCRDLKSRNEIRVEIFSPVYYNQ